MTKKRHKYHPKLDILHVEVEETDEPVNLVEAVGDCVFVNMNPKTGAIYSLEIRSIKTQICNPESRSPFIDYDEATDCLQINFGMDGYEKIGCDCVFMDLSENAMITLDRNEVGNLQGVEIVAVSYFLS